MEGDGDAFAAGTSNCELHRHDRQPHYKQEKEVDQHKGGPAVLPYDKGKTPHVSQPDRASGGDQHKAEPRCEGFSLFHFYTLLF